MARDFLYQPPGKNTPLVVVGGWRMGRSVGADFVGKDELVPLGRPVPATAGVTTLAEIWRRGERQGPKAGLLVGVRYHLGGDLVVDARREELRVVRVPRDALLLLGGDDDDGDDYVFPWDRRDEVVIEPEEPPFIRALVRALAREDRRAPLSPRARALRAPARSRSAGTERSPRRRG